MSEDNTIENMIDYAANADFNKANAIFNDMIAQKMDAAIDQEKIAVANQIFNDVDEEELEAEADADAEEAATDVETEDDDLTVEEPEESEEEEVEGHPV